MLAQVLLLLGVLLGATLALAFSHLGILGVGAIVAGFSAGNLIGAYV